MKISTFHTHKICVRNQKERKRDFTFTIAYVNINLGRFGMCVILMFNVYMYSMERATHQDSNSQRAIEERHRNDYIFVVFLVAPSNWLNNTLKPYRQSNSNQPNTSIKDSKTFRLKHFVCRFFLSFFLSWTHSIGFRLLTWFWYSATNFSHTENDTNVCAMQCKFRRWRFMQCAEKAKLIEY